MNNNYYLVSVIIAAYNAEKYINELLDSVCNQSYPNLEIIVINDGSKDHTLDIINSRSRNDSRIKVVSQINSGVSAARNKGFDVSSGDYIIFVDADDVLNKCMISTLLKNALDVDADVSICDVKMCYPNENIELSDIINLDSVYDLSKYDAMKNFLLGEKIRSGMWNKLIKRSVIKDLAFEEGKRVNEDKFFCFETLNLCNRIAYTDNQLYYYMIRDGSATRNKFDDRWFDTTYFADKIYNQLKNSDLEIYARFSRTITYYSLVKRIVESGSKTSYLQEYNRLITKLKSTRLQSLHEFLSLSTYIGVGMIKICVPLFEFVTLIYSK